MKHLHTVNSPDLLELCFQAAEYGDTLLLIEDGVYGAQQAYIDKMPAGITVYALQCDLEARGFTDRIGEQVTAAEVSDFVSLCCEHGKIINWF
jgi:tRNA 2-thiouridine synthesizing protein B